MRPTSLAPLLLIALAPAAIAQTTTRPVVLELYTSEACSSCPPAEALLTQLAQQPGILALSFHVTYWNGPDWTDKYALTGATDRQGWYAGLQHSDDVYTPEAIIDGGNGLVGSNRDAITAAIAAAQQNTATAVPVTVTSSNNVTIKIGNGPGPAQIWLFGFDPHHTTQIGGGENAGATLNETNIVRSITSLGTWTGIAMTYTMPKPAGAHMAVLLQTATGNILGAAGD
jgi:hypothetical protein